MKSVSNFEQVWDGWKKGDESKPSNFEYGSKVLIIRQHLMGEKLPSVVAETGLRK